MRRLTTLAPSCAECYEIWEPQPPGNSRASLGLYTDSFIFTIVNIWVWVTGQIFYDLNLFIYYAIFCNERFLKNATTALQEKYLFGFCICTHVARDKDKLCTMMTVVKVHVPENVEISLNS